MKHLIHKINFKDVKEQIKNFRFSIPDLIIGIVIGAVIAMIW